MKVYVAINGWDDDHPGRAGHTKVVGVYTTLDTARAAALEEQIESWCDYVDVEEYELKT